MQNRGKTYTRNKNQSQAHFKNIPYLNDIMLLGHLKGTYSYGVFATNYTKFMLFDFDFKDDEANCKWYYRKVFSSLIELGIPKENLYTVFSGSKVLKNQYSEDYIFSVKKTPRSHFFGRYKSNKRLIRTVS